MRRLLLVVVAAALGGCSFTTGSGFTECEADTDCGAVSGCTRGYCLPLPAGCRRVTGAFDEPGRVLLAAIQPLAADGGAVSDNEVQRLRAMALAVDEANSVGGISFTGAGARHFALVTCETMRTDDAVGALTSALATNFEVVALLTSGSDMTLAAAVAPARRDAGVPLLSPSATSAALNATFREAGDVWRVAPPDTLQARVVARLVKQAVAASDAGARVSVVYEMGPYGQQFADPLNDLLLDGGVDSATHPLDKANPDSFTNVVNTLANRQPAVTVLIAFPDQVRTIVGQAKGKEQLRRSSGHRWFLTDAAKSVQVLDATTRDELFDVRGTAPSQNSGPAYSAFSSAFSTRYGTSPASASFTAHAWDATWLAMSAAAGASADGGAITGPRANAVLPRLSAAGQAALPLRGSAWAELSGLLQRNGEVNVEGASGALDFDVDAGAPSGKYEVWQVVDGGIVVQETVDP